MLALEEIIGDEVVSEDGKLIGVIDGVAIDTDTWTAPVIKICLNRGMEVPIGINKPLFGAACFFMESSNIESISDIVTLTKKLTDLSNFVINPSQVPLLAGDIVGKRVTGSKGRVIGIVESITFTTQGNWAVQSLIVRLDRGVVDDMNLIKTLFKTPTISIATNEIRTIGDLVMLSIDAMQLKERLEKN